MHRNALMICERSSTVYVGLFAPVHNGGCCPMICHRGTPYINKPNAGLRRECLKIWCMICEPCYAWPKARKNSLLPPFSMVVPSNLRLKVENEQATMGINEGKAARS